MKYEVEQKFYVEDLGVVERVLMELGSTLADPVSQSDIYLGHPARDFAKTDEAFRLRYNGSETFVTYKGPRINATTKTRAELELAMPAGTEFRTQLSELVRLLGFAVVANIHKRRRAAVVEWEGVAVDVVLDEVAGLGSFVELEIESREAGIEQAHHHIASLATRLGLTRNERRSYCELILGRTTFVTAEVGCSTSNPKLSPPADT